MVELWLKIMQIGCLALKAHSLVMCLTPLVHKKFAQKVSSGELSRVIHMVQK